MQQRQQPDRLSQARRTQMSEQQILEQEIQSDIHNIGVYSLGEYVLPFFVAGMEACWLNAALIGLAGLDFLQSSTALMPFWGPPLLLFVTLLLFRRATRKEAEAEDAGKASEDNLGAIPGIRLMLGVLAVLTLLLIWLHLYSSTYSLFDPGWVLAFGSDILALSNALFQMIVMIGVTVYCTWRGMKLAQLEVQAKNLFRHVWAPEQIFRQLWIGLLVFLAAILIRTRLPNGGNATDEIILVLLIPIFLYCSLSAHALARVVLIRHDHPFGLEGSINAQERSLLGVINTVGVVLALITISGGVFFSSAFFNTIQPLWNTLGTAYSWLTAGIAQILVWLLTPLFALINMLFPHGATLPGNPQRGAPPTPRVLPHVKPHSSPPSVLIIVIDILIPVLFFLTLTLLIRLALRRRKRLRVSLNRKTGDIHESLWSWQLFWSQFKAFWASIFRRLFPARAVSEEQSQIAEEIVASPAVRTIREIYRALLKKAEQRGHRRKRDETPYEFRRRLNEHETDNEPQLGMLTDAYALTRYGGGSPNEHEINIVRGLWNELEKKWEASS